LIDITSIFDLRKSNQPPLVELWCGILQAYFEVFKFVVHKLLSFSTAHLHEIVFSRYAGRKTKCRNRLNAAPGKKVGAPGSKLDRYIYNPDEDLLWFSSVSPGE
jgi:hypothetical protein